MPCRCQLRSVLSYGSEGVVYAGLRCGTPFAIKGHYARCAENEMKPVKKFNHTNIIKCFDLEHERGAGYLSMEYITGGNSYEFIRGKLNSISYWIIVAQVLTDVARRMAYLHDHNIVQGDLKSQNVLLRDETHQDLICDFSTSRSLDNDIEIQERNQTSKGSFLSGIFLVLCCTLLVLNSVEGTVRWMAPEICALPPEQASIE